MTTKANYDVLIVGGGAAGVRRRRRCRQTGARVGLIEWA